MEQETQEDIPLRASVKQPALILHKYLSERRLESAVSVYSHTPGVGLRDQSNIIFTMDEEHPYERVELRRTGRNRTWHSRSGEAARLKRLSWSISDLHQLPGSSKSLTSRRHERVRNASISSCSLSSGNH